MVRGGGEMATAVARLLFLSGMRVVVLERAQPLAVRRLVSFAEAVFAGEVGVEGVRGRLGDVPPEAAPWVPVVVDPDGRVLERFAPDVVVDARMAKRGGNGRPPGPALVIGLGPGFAAGAEVDAVIETQRGPDLGRVLWTGQAEADTSRPSPVLGHADTRVLRAPRGGIFTGRVALGDLIQAGDEVGEVGGAAVASAIAGLVRGLLHDGVVVEAGVKVGDVDPRGRGVDPARISDKARAVAAGALEAVFLRAGGFR